ncbi:hypothetical protein FACS1894152_4170 [Bacilli bacterium]|nr:hypothetical protein FACS1894152_4170 [Bacilli bacterium]
MTIDGSALGSACYASVFMMTDQATALAAYTTTIGSYMDSNIGIIGNYSGMVGSNADPANGSYSLKFNLDFGDMANIKSFLSGLTDNADPDGFMVAMCADMMAHSTVSMTTPIIMTTSFTLTPATIDTATLASCTTASDCWQIMGKAIVDNLKSLTFPPTATTSIYGGSGITTFVGVS